MKIRAWQVMAAFAALTAGGALAQGALENPHNGATESGIAAITGWHCTSRSIELYIDGTTIGAPGMGTPRGDTAQVCGRSDTGFSYLYNYSLLKGGRHRIDAYADGTLFASATFDVGYLGKEFLTGVAVSHTIPDFPVVGLGTHVAWSQTKQNYVVTLVEPPLAPSIVGTYALRHISMLTTAGMAMSSLQPGWTIGGTIAFRTDGTFSLSFTMSYGGQTLSDAVSGRYVDNGFYVATNGEIDVIVERGDTLTFHTIGSTGTDFGTMAVSATRNVPAAPLAGTAADGPKAVGAVSGIGHALAAGLTAVSR